MNLAIKVDSPNNEKRINEDDKFVYFFNKKGFIKGSERQLANPLKTEERNGFSTVWEGFFGFDYPIIGGPNYKYLIPKGAEYFYDEMEGIYATNRIELSHEDFLSYNEIMDILNNNIKNYIGEFENILKNYLSNEETLSEKCVWVWESFNRNYYLKWNNHVAFKIDLFGEIYDKHFPKLSSNLYSAILYNLFKKLKNDDELRDKLLIKKVYLEYEIVPIHGFTFDEVHKALN